MDKTFLSTSVSLSKEIAHHTTDEFPFSPRTPQRTYSGKAATKSRFFVAALLRMTYESTQESEYFAQRRKGAKEKSQNSENLASWRLGASNIPIRELLDETNLRVPGKFSSLVIRSLGNYFSEVFVSFVLFVVNNPFPISALLALNFLLPASLLAQELLRAGTIFSATQAPLWAAKEGQYFEKYGIRNLEIIQFSGGQPVTRALIGGDIQISTTGGAAVVNARLKGADTVIIARTVGVFPYTLFVGKEIRDAADLKGRKLAVSTVGGSGYVAMQYALRKLGLDPDRDVAMLQIGDFATRLASLGAGTVQGALLIPPFTLRARELGLRPLYDLVGSGIQYPINQITVRQSFIKSHRETVKNFMRAFVSGLARFRTDREFGTRVLGKNLRENDPKILQETYDFWLKVFPKIPNPGPEDATVFLELMKVKDPRDWREFVDTSVMDELNREGFLSSVYK